MPVFLDATTPDFERELINEGVDLFKYWLEVSNEEQEKRFQDRINDRSKNWKLLAVFTRPLPK